MRDCPRPQRDTSGETYYITEGSRDFVPLFTLEVGPFSAGAGQLGFGQQKVLAIVRESRSPGSTRRVLTTSGAIAAQKPFLQQRAVQPLEHGCDSNYRQETVRKLTPQAG